MVISATGISKFFGKKAALDNVTIDIPASTVFILVGPNGAGKTTLLRILCKELKPSTGVIKTKNGGTFAVAEENRDFFKNFDAENYADMWALLYPGFDKGKFFNMLKELKIPCDKPVEHYSKGMKTWLHNSLIISSNSEVMIFDEPLQHLDPAVRLKFHSILHEEALKSRTLIISTHEIDEFDKYAMHLAIIHNGKIVLSDEVSKTVFEHRMIPGTQSAANMTVIGPVFGEKLVKTKENTGRQPLLKEIAAGYINGCDLGSS
ncbi:MAG TPA: ATP-binding cassette domain-containing protein [bacterium]|nr:ATP-binding cassette domain-containing protein [bacterium]